MNTPLASKTTVSSRNKMAAGLHNNHQSTAAATTTKTTSSIATTSRLPPRTAFKPPLTKTERTVANLAATSSRIALSRSRLSGNNAETTTTAIPAATASKLQPTNAASTIYHRTTATSRAPGTTNHRLPSSSSLSGRTTIGASSLSGGVPSFANSRSSSKLSSVSSSVTNNNNNNLNNINHSSSRQSSLSNAQATIRKHTTTPATGSLLSSYVPDTNAIRRGLAKFSNPIECQRQFQALNSKLRELTEMNDHKEKTISGLQDQLEGYLNRGVGYATVVQYLAKKLKIDSDVDLERECEQLKTRVNELLVNEREYENRLEAIVDDYRSHLQVELDLRAAVEREFEETRVKHSDELVGLKETHRNELADLEEAHSNIKNDLENRIVILETDLNARTKELSELRKEYEALNTSYSKLEESLTKDKDARVKYAQEKVNQLQKDVESLNSVLDMRTERIHALEKDSILLDEVQQELMTSQDLNKALKQQLESLTAALENKRVQYENLLAEHEQLIQDLKRERKERRRMTMRTEQLEYVLNESCATENNITVLDSSVET